MSLLQMNQSTQSKVIKVILAGPSGVGKTTLITRFMKGEFLKVHVPSSEETHHKVSFNTNVGKIAMDVLETQTIVPSDYKDFDYVVCIKDRDSVFAFPRIFPQNIWNVVRGNTRCDENEINIKTNQNIEKLFLEIAKDVLENRDIEYVPEEARDPPVAIVFEEVEEICKELLRCAETEVEADEGEIM